MGNNGLVDPKPGVSPACCFSGPVQCPAVAPVAYKIQHYFSYSIPRYNRIHIKQSGPGKAAAGDCPSVPGSGALPRPVLAPACGA